VGTATARRTKPRADRAPDLPRAPGAALDAALRHARRPDVRARWVYQLRRLVALPTVTASAAHRPAMDAAARLLCDLLSHVGLRRCAIVRAAPFGPANVVAEWLGRPGRPVLLLYAHIDVQPPGPLTAWHTPPFSGLLAEGRVHGRGASDNKGPLVAVLAALESHLATSGRLPVNVRVWFDGEEESGNPHLVGLLARHSDRLRCDGLVVCDDTRLAAPDRATLVTGLRGSADLRLTVRGPARALHSGLFGGEVLDPALVLARLLASLWSDGRVAVPGFYRRVRTAPPGLRAALAAGRPPARDLAQMAAVPSAWLTGEPGWEPGERSTLRPSLTVTELTTGPGRAASAIAPVAAARINLRLVPGQQPRQVAALVCQHVFQQSPAGVRSRIDVLATVDPVDVPLGHPLVSATRRALTATWHVPPALTRSGGTVGAVPALRRRFGAPVAMWGLSGAGDGVHAADESFAVADLQRGTEAVSRLLAEAAR
jgi:acetylornithine deacetylase/succinyl-diaminopimelate desuccinylase-like protein